MRLAPAHLQRVVNNAEIYSPEEAVPAGLLDRVVPAADVAAAAQAEVARLLTLKMPAHAATIGFPALGACLVVGLLAGVLSALLTVYTLSGAIYGIAALLSVARTGVGDPQAGQTENLDSITAVVLGGTSLFGGRGSIAGTLLGALIVGVFRNGLTLMGVSSVYQVLITGIRVILAVAADKLSRRGAR